jgi:hypothetical protein
MARYLIDTDAFIDYLNGMPGATALLSTLANDGETLCLCDVVIAEVFSGIGSRPSPKAESLIAAAEFIPISMEDAIRAGIWRYDYARQGRQLSTTDTLVAAAAFQVGAIVITADLNDYPMPEVSLLPLPR